MFFPRVSPDKKGLLDPISASEAQRPRANRAEIRTGAKSGGVDFRPPCPGRRFRAPFEAADSAPKPQALTHGRARVGHTTVPDADPCLSFAPRFAAAAGRPPTDCLADRGARR